MKILCTDPIPPLARELLEPLGEVEIYSGDNDLAEAAVLIVRRMLVGADVIAAAPSLRIIARTGVGVDVVDVAAATERGIPVLFAPGAGTIPMAEGAFTLILASVKRLGELGALVRSGGWDRRYEVVTGDLHGSVLGVVGFGSIGREVARLGAAFGMEVLAHDPIVAADGSTSNATHLVTLHELMARSDVVTLHCPLTQGTRGMIDRSLLSQAKRGVILVNAARGPIIDGDDLLVEALEQGWLGAVGLDVFDDEPPDPRHPLLSHPRVVATPHAIGLTARWNQSVFGSLATDVGAILRGEIPENVVNPEALQYPARAAQAW